MRDLCRWSVRAYDVLLGLFPCELRGEFGAEMREAFEEDLKLESSVRGLNGALRVWRSALREVIWIGLPGWLRTPLVAVPLFSACTIIALQCPMLIMGTYRGADAGDRMLGATLVAISIDTVVTTLTAFAAVYRWKTSRIISLSLR